MSFKPYLDLIFFITVLRISNAIVLNKCCGSGEVLDEKYDCVKNTNSATVRLDPPIDNLQNQLKIDNLDYALKHNNPCYVSNFSMLPLSAFRFSDTDGSLRLRSAPIKQLQVENDFFCLDSFLGATYVMFCPCLEHDCRANKIYDNLTLYFCDYEPKTRPIFNLTSAITISHNYTIKKKQLDCLYMVFTFEYGVEFFDDEALIDYILPKYEISCIGYDDYKPNLFDIRLCRNPKIQAANHFNFKIYYTFVTIEFILTAMIIFLHVWLEELNTIYGKCLIFHAGASFLTKIVYISVHATSYFKNSTIADGFPRFSLGLIIYYFAFASFCWMNVMCFDMAYTFSGKTRTIRSKSFEGKRQSKLRYYSLYSWGVPVLFTIIISIMEWTLPSASPFNPNFGSYYWFAPDKKMNTIFYYAPLCFQLGSNIIFFGFVIYRIILLSRGTEILHTSESGTNKQGEPKLSRKRVILFLKIFVVMGITWTIKLLPWLVTVTTLYNVVISSLDCLRSLCIFILFCCNRKVWKGIQKKLRETKIWKYFVKEDSQPTTAPNSCGTTTSSLSNRSNYKDNIEMTMKSD